MEKTSNVYGRFFQGVLIGSFLGGLAGLFFAPKPGKELRADVKEKGLEAQAEAQALFENARHRATEWKDGAKHRFDRIRGAFRKERAPEYTEPMEGEGIA
jgi:gas vesicle protein